MIPELAWMLMPVTMLLSQIGGFRWKWVRRIGIPVVVVAACYFWVGWSWWLIAAGVSIGLAARMPYTLIGDDIFDHWFNWVWIPIAAFVVAFSPFPIVFAYGRVDLFLWGAGLQFGTAFICFVLNTIPVSHRYFPWKLCEAVAWSMTGVWAVLGQGM